jgi:hypothetical protein
MAGLVAVVDADGAALPAPVLWPEPAGAGLLGPPAVTGCDPPAEPVVVDEPHALNPAVSASAPTPQASTLRTRGRTEPVMSCDSSLRGLGAAFRPGLRGIPWARRSALGARRLKL